MNDITNTLTDEQMALNLAQIEAYGRADGESETSLAETSEVFVTEDTADHIVN